MSEKAMLQSYNHSRKCYEDEVASVQSPCENAQKTPMTWFFLKSKLNFVQLNLVYLLNVLRVLWTEKTP